MSETTKKSEVLTAVAGITAALAKEGVSKDGLNRQQGYSFRGIDQVLNALASEYAERGVVVVPSYANRQVSERETRNGGALFYVTVEGTFTIYAAKDGSSLVSGPFFGEAMDSADKATNKAMSAAYKYFAIQTFAIPTEGDNDADATTHEVATKKRSAPRLNPVPSGDGPSAKQIKLLHYQGIRVYGKAAWADKLAAGVKKATGSDTGSPTELSRDDFSKWVDYLKDKPDFSTEPEYLTEDKEEALAIEADEDVADADGELPF